MIFKKLLFILVVFLFLGVSLKAQTVIASDGFNNSTSLFSIAITPTPTSVGYLTGNTAVGDRPASSPYAAEGTYSYGVRNGEVTLTSNNVDTSLYNNIEMTFRLASFSYGSAINGADPTDIVKVEVSDDGTNWYSNLRVLGNSNACWSFTGGTATASTVFDNLDNIPVDISPIAGNLRTTDGYSTVKITGLPAITNLRFRITLFNNLASELWVIDDFKVTGCVNNATSIASGNWSDPNTWLNGKVPYPSSNVTIKTGHTVTIDNATFATRNIGKTTTIETGATLATGAFAYNNNGTTTVNGTFRIDNTGSVSGNDLVYDNVGTTSTLVITNPISIPSVSGPAFPASNSPYNVTVTGSGGGLTIESGITRTVPGTFSTAAAVALIPTAVLQLNGICQINSGGNFTNSAPTYGSASTLIYNIGGTPTVGNEWTSTATTPVAGIGTPQNVTIQNSTTLSMPAAVRSMAGNLHIATGGLVLNTTVNSDFYISGNWTRASGATFTPNSRLVNFTSAIAITQVVTVFPSGTETFDTLVIQTNSQVQLAIGTNVSVTANTGFRLSSSNSSSNLDLNGQTVTLLGGGSILLASGPRKISSSIAGGSLVVTSVALSVGAGSGTLTTDVNTVVKLSSQLSILVANCLTINGTLQINSGGSVATFSPKYGNSSLLQYNSTGTFNRSKEWTSDIATIGVTAGYPNNVQISNNTTLNYYNVSTGAKGMYGNLTIDSGSLLTFGAISTGGALTVLGNVTNAGTITLGIASGNDLKTGGNFSNIGTFNGNNRTLFFIKNGSQTIYSSTPLTIPYIQTGVNTTAITTLQIVNTSSSITISAPLGGNAIVFNNATDVFDLNGKSLTIGTTAVANAISGSGTFSGGTTSSLTLLGTGSIGTLSFSGLQSLDTFTMNRQAGTIGCVLGSPLTVNTSLALTNGLIDLGTNNLTLGASASTSGASSNSYVLAFGTNGGQLLKTFSGAGSFTYPIGDNTSGLDYSPATLNLSGGTYAGTVGMRVVDAIHPSNIGATDYLTRYWQLYVSGVSPTSYTFTGTYASSGDIFGLEANCLPARHDGSNWVDIGGTSISSNTCTISGSTFPSLVANDCSAGSGYPEINIKGVVGSNPSIFSGDITPSSTDNTLFVSTTIGNTLTKTFRIENLGVLSLNISSITLSNSTDFSVTASAPYTINGSSFIDFTITFNPASLGTLTSTVSIVSNDFTGGENPYTFLIQGDGTCAPTTNTVTPNSGPVGTVVTINSTLPYNLTGATANFNGVAATITSISSSQATVVVPANAVSGTLVTTNSQGCQASNTFTVINNFTTSCQGTPTVSDLFISEVTDATYGGLTYIEIYNGTGAAINLSDYRIQFFANGGSSSYATQQLSGTLANLSTYVISTSLSGFSCTLYGGDGILANLQTSISGINFVAGENDYIGLYKISTSTTIDSFGLFGSAIWADGLGIGDRGVTFRRKNNATVPKYAYSNVDWNITDWLGTGASSCPTNDYSDIGVYSFLSGTPPTISQQPNYSPTCKATSFTIAGSEGYSGGNSLAYQWYAVAPNTTSWSAITDTGVYSGSTSANLNISDVSSLIGYQYYCQIRENTATCYSASNAVIITGIPSTTWQAGNTWSNGTPTVTTAVVINNNYDTAVYGSFEACSVTVNNGFTLNIKSGNYVSIVNDLTVNTGATLLVQNNGSLVMVNDNGVVTNNGTTQVLRTASGIRGFDYVYWTSPVIGQSIDNIYSSPTPGYKYKWNPLATNINSPTSSGNWQPTSGTMLPGTGYIVRGSSSYGMTSTNINSVFTGKVNSGIVSPSITRGSYEGVDYLGASSVTVNKFNDNWNLIGNPYPSAIKVLDFLAYNTNIQGFIYLWTHGTAPASVANPFYDSFAYNYTSNDYITYNGTATTSGPLGFNGYLASSQGFFALMNDGATSTQTVSFKNSMRSKTYDNSQFYRLAQTQDNHRIWLDLLDTNNNPVRAVVGYVSEATNSLDRLYDAYKNITNDKNIYSLAEDETLIIQGRALPFDVNDQVPIGVNILQDGNYKIAIAAVDGLFEEGQPIYIEDKLMNIIYDLRQSPYDFYATVGITNNRFVLRYTNETLATPDFETLSNSVIIVANHGELTIKSHIESIQDIVVYDVLGRQLFQTKEVNNKTFLTSNISMSQQALIVKITLENGMIITRKIIL